MKKRLLLVLCFAVLMMIAFCIVCYSFDTKFADLTIDWVAFVAGIFLMIEGSWRLFTTNDPFFPLQLFRIIRAIIGVNIFTIHLLQFMRF